MSQHGSPITIYIPGKPVPWARTRGAGNKRFKCKKVRDWQTFAAWCAKGTMKLRTIRAGPINLAVTAKFIPPPSWPAWKREMALKGKINHTSTPDSDTLLKILCDAFNGIVWIDDAQICQVSFAKMYGDTARVMATVETLPGHSSNITKKPTGLTA